MFELTRNQTVESLHHGALAVVDAHGQLLASFGDPQVKTFLRSSAKPFQALPFIERGGHSRFGFSMREIAVICASHYGTDDHVKVITSLMRKVGIAESELCCGVHYPIHEPTAIALRLRREEPTPVRHNCSGKHSGMLAFTHLDGFLDQSLLYIDPAHPIQKIILQTFAEMCGMSATDVELGTDGCSAPNFAVPLQNAAWAYARLVDPQSSQVTPNERNLACQTITTAMWSHPDMIGGPGSFDTRFMEVGCGRWIAKGGAEGYQGVGIMPGVLSPGSPGIGIALKVADGDQRGRVRQAIILEALRQLGIMTSKDEQALADMGPGFNLYNWRKILIGKAYPIFQLDKY